MITIQKAVLEDARLFYITRFDNAANIFSNNQTIPKYKDHFKWYKTNHTKNFYTIVFDNQKIGYVRIDERNEISMALLPEYKRMGYGTEILKIITIQFKGLYATIKKDNTASIKLFTKFPEIKIIVED